MSRWRVYASRRTPWWFYARETFFVDAPDAEAATAAIEGRSWDVESLTVTDVTPATEDMEAAHSQRLTRRAQWLACVARGENPRWLL